MSIDVISAQSVFEVVSTADSGSGSLRTAITNANSFSGADTIRFNIPGAGPHIITPTSALPQITEAVEIDGYSQPGASPNTNSIADPSNAVIQIGIDGSSAGIQNGFEIRAGGTTIKGLAIYNFSIGGLYLESTGGNHISGCHIGVDVTGTIARPNANHGVSVVNGSSDMIGGTNPADRNVISGNLWVGVMIIKSGTVGTIVQGNFIGLDATGTQPLGNGQHGINAGRAATGTVASGFIIGGTETEARNVVSSNTWSGVLVLGVGATGFSVKGNYIGTDRTGTADRGNGISGIEMFDGPNNGEVDDNLVSANTNNGIVCQQNCDNISITGNIVGTDPSTTQSNLGNGIDGIVVVDADNLTIGGPGADDANIVANNGRVGIYAWGSSSGTHVIEGNIVGTGVDKLASLGNDLAGIRVEWVGHTVRGNHVANNVEGIVVLGSGHRLTQNEVRNNDGIGIDIGGDGRSVNDPGDGDTGNNNGQNYPEISDVAFDSNANEITVTYQVPTLPSNAQYPLTVEFFVSENGQGARFVGSDTYSSSDFSTGPDKTISFTPLSGVSPSTQLVATATDAGGQSSEFSDVTTALPLSDLPDFASELAIVSVFPNPVKTTMNVVIAVPEASAVVVDIVDILGRSIRTVQARRLASDRLDVQVPTIDLPAGLYFVRARQGALAVTRKIIVTD